MKICENSTNTQNNGTSPTLCVCYSYPTSFLMIGVLGAPYILWVVDVLLSMLLTCFDKTDLIIWFLLSKHESNYCLGQNDMTEILANEISWQKELSKKRGLGNCISMLCWSFITLGWDPILPPQIYSIRDLTHSALHLDMYGVHFTFLGVFSRVRLKQVLFLMCFWQQ